MIYTVGNQNKLLTGKNPVSLVLIFVLSAFALGLFLTMADFVDSSRILANDVISYYNYLPAAFKYHNFEFDKLPLRAWYNVSPEGFVVEKVSMGLAFLYLPFYLAALLVVHVGGLSDFEYSTPFSFAIGVSAIFYFITGLFFLRKILLQYFSDIVATLGIAALFLGTNMVYYTSYEGAMSHSYVFALIAAFIWLVISWHKNPSWKTTLAIGLVSGLLTLIRPSTLIIVLFAAFYAVFDSKSLKLKVQFIRENLLKILFMAVVALIVWVPQMIYWKCITGHLLYFSYVGERFFWNDPKILEGLFSYRSGWLMYNPVMIFSIIGMFFLNGELKRFRWGIISCFLITVYMLFSWWCWWWVGLGSRSMIELYPLLGIALCAFIDWMLKRPVIAKTFVFTLFALLMSFGLLKNWQYKKGMVHYDGMTAPAYWGVFWSLEMPEGYWNMIKCPDYDKAREGNRTVNQDQ